MPDKIICLDGGVRELYRWPMPSTLSMVEILERPEQAGALLQPERIRIVEHLQQPDSASGIARKLGLKRQQVNYHVRQLEKEGLLELVEERKKGNCVERIVRATARTYLVGPQALGRLGCAAPETQDRLSATYLIAVAARTIRDLAWLRRGTDAEKKRLATLTLEASIRFATAADRNSFFEELTNELARLAAKYHNEEAEGGRVFRVMAASYPAVAQTDGDGG
jgi:DNA-binding transcriptional ArsR family regulator